MNKAHLLASFLSYYGSPALKTATCISTGGPSSYNGQPLRYDVQQELAPAFSRCPEPVISKSTAKTTACLSDVVDPSAFSARDTIDKTDN